MKKISTLLFCFALALVAHAQQQQTKPEETPPTPSPLLGSKTDTLGVVFLTDKTPTYTIAGEDYYSIIGVRKFQRLGKDYTMIHYRDNEGWQVNYHGAVMLSQVGRLPETVGNAKDFFRTGVLYQNAVNTRFNFTRGMIELALGQNTNNSIVPASFGEAYNAQLKAERLKWNNFTTDVGISGNVSNKQLTNFGASHARLLSAVFADTLANYPYRTLPDQGETKDVLAWWRTDYEKKFTDGKLANKKLQSHVSVVFNKLWDDSEFGRLAPTPQETFTRREEAADTRAELWTRYGFGWKKSCDYEYDKRLFHTLNFIGLYTFNRIETNVKRTNMPLFDGLRNAHEITYGATYSIIYNQIVIDLKNKHYASNTADNYTNMFPSAKVVVDLNKLARLYNFEWWNYNVNLFKIHASASRSMSEAALVYRNYAALSTAMTANDALRNFYEDREIFAQTEKMTPEIYENYETGLRMNLWKNKVITTFSYFNTTTRGMIAPYNTAGEFFLQNVGDVRNAGFLVDVLHQNTFGIFRDEERYYRHRIHYSVNFTFSAMQSKVLSVAGGYEKVALAGFADAGNYFAAGEPMGAIFGTTYERMSDGSLAYNDNGEPIINPQLQRIGNPAPDFTVGITPQFGLLQFSLSCAMEYNHGGDRWNGTRAAQENNPAKAAEDYIERASYFRIAQVALSYRLPERYTHKLKVISNLNVGVSAHNLLLVSPYKGVDPASELFGYSVGRGLDLFNMPSVRSFQIFLKLTI